MVLWTRFAVMIVVLSYSTFAKMENNLQSIEELLPREFLGYCGNNPGCRYSKFLSALKDNFNTNEEASNYNLKMKKNLGTEQSDVLQGNDNLDGEPQLENKGFKIEDANGNDNLINSYDEFDFLEPDLMKRGHSSPSTGCDCRITNELIDLGHLYYPRYLLNAVCQKNDEAFEYPPKCWRGAQCKPLEYKVRVLTHRSHNDHQQKDPTTSLLPDTLRSLWKFKTVTVAAGCFCS
ncbi:uncharacterized protein LOC129908981 [Episyrphus balteatus]|uniref:uncharacterized protein LOC129908981 n=1 Tax=Episyrphus balteatus TaxID=286459 RepID=UPI002484FB16|nr:uncharacterized protein LOC129908981 [Episyrphus balteatus]